MKLKRMFKTNKKGQSLVEMTLIAPLLLLMFLGVVEVGWALRSFIVLQNANREATRFAARGRYLDFSKLTPEEIGYPVVLQHELDSLGRDAEGKPQQLPLDVGSNPNGTVIISHILVDTGKCETDPDRVRYNDLILTPLTPGYERFMVSYGDPNNHTQMDFAAEAEKMRQDNEKFNCDLAAASPQTLPSVNSAVIVETYYKNYQLLGIPIIANRFTNPVMLYTRTIMRISADSRGNNPSAGEGCEVYPIALNINSLNGLHPNDNIGDVFNGSGSGNFGWLRWTDNNLPSYSNPNSEGFLNEETENPRLSMTAFEEANDPSDTSLSAGDDVWGLTGVVNSDDTRDLLTGLIDNGTTIRVPVWDSAGDTGSNGYYHVQRFVLIRLNGFRLSGGGGNAYGTGCTSGSNCINATFIGEDNVCPSGD
jgi:hypothetical protein